MTRERARFAPDAAMVPHYGGRYRTYGMLTEAMGPVWRRIDSMRTRG